MSNKYILDGQLIDWTELIYKADKEGCEWTDRAIKTTSEAARFLRSEGYEVVIDQQTETESRKG